MELTLDEALQKGIEAHKAGKAQEADRYYTAILKANSKHPDANHNMGVLAVGLGKVEEAVPFFKTAVEVNPNIDQYWLSYIDVLIKLNRIADAKTAFEQVNISGAIRDGFDKIEKRLSLGTATSSDKNSYDDDPPQNQLQALVKLCEQGQFEKALNDTLQLLKEFSGSVNLYNILGAANQTLGKLEEAIDAYTKALSIKPDFVEAYNNIGISLRNLGKLDEALEAYKKALSIKPDFAEAYNNMGFALKAQGKVEEAIDAFGNALYVKPDYVDAYNNMGNALQDQGELNKAIDAYNKALSIQPDYTEAHRNLSLIKKYKDGDNQIVQVKELYKKKNLSEDAKCNLSFALAKMYEDIGDIHKSFIFLSEGNTLRKKVLGYSINQDKAFFVKLKKTQPFLLKNSLKVKKHYLEPSPIFILGMPRSGTTLVEQIVSSHSKVTGAGELDYISQYGYKFFTRSGSINTMSVSEFREQYLEKLSQVSHGMGMVTDKMPQNFYYIPLICAALPEAKIIHVQRNAAATCWSNYKHYFATKHLGYCYDLNDVVEYYNLYVDLMQHWHAEYSDRIYNLNYENLISDQENQTRKLIKHLDLNWQDACLSPHKNKRSVRTASQQQVREKVYKGSSEVWRKYEKYLNGALDGLSSL